MALLQALDSKTEISGAAILAFVNAMGPFRSHALNLLARYGIADISADKWYSQQACFNAFRHVPDKIGGKAVMAIGRNMLQHLRIPGGTDTLEQALAVMDAVYQDNYKNGNAGTYRFRKTGERECTMFCSSPYPCAFDQGMLQGICDRFRPEDAERVSIEHSAATGCRQQGSVACTYVIRW